MALAVLAQEVGDLTAEFQWLTEEASYLVRGDEDSSRDRVIDEFGDISIYLLRLCYLLGVDLLAAAVDKIRRNGGRFPTGQVSGYAVCGRDVRKVA